MSTIENKALVRRLIAAWNRGDLADMAQYWSPDMVHYSRGEALPAHAVFDAMSGLMRAFPDVKLEIEAMVAEGDLVASMLRLTATHDGEYIGLPPTGRTVSCSLMGIVRVIDGKVVEHWGVGDGLDLLQQLGVIPSEYLAATA